MENNQSGILLSVALLLISLVGYFLLGYAVPRSDFYLFISIYSLLFAIYFYTVYRSPAFFLERDWKVYFAAALFLRLVFLFAIPSLTDDFWRYLWDGRLLSHGLNPYGFVPSELLENPIFEEAFLGQLYPNLNSPDFYTVYPPIQQLIFAVSTFFFCDNVLASIILLRIITIFFEFGTIYLLIKLFQLFKKSIQPVFFYAFNPLIIIELTGNLHTEFSMIFFLTLAFYKLCQQKLDASAISFALAVGAKLLPLLFLPLFLRRLWFWKGLRYCLIVGLLNIVLFLPFFTIDLLQKIQTSMRLYFTYFEFNASIYYILRYWLVKDWWLLWDYHEHFKHLVWVENLLRIDWYNLLRQALPVLDILLILLLSVQKSVVNSLNYFFRTILFIYTLHFLMATTVHPWYLSSLILFSVLTPYRFVLCWSYLIGWTYFGYQTATFIENSWIIIVEYTIVFVFLLWEYNFLKKNKMNKLTTSETLY